MNKILIIDDDKDMQSILSDIVDSEGYRSIVAGNGRKALQQIRKHIPDLILLDMKLPGMNGMKVLEKIKNIDRDLKVLMLTGYGDIKDAVQAIKLGAFDYITKPFDNDEIVKHIKNAMQSRNCTNGRDIVLSLREREVLHWLKKGKSSWDIAAILNISERTVYFHVNNIMQKLNAVSRTQAVAIALEKGLISTE